MRAGSALRAHGEAVGSGRNFILARRAQWHSSHLSLRLALSHLAPPFRRLALSRLRLVPPARAPAPRAAPAQPQQMDHDGASLASTVPEDDEEDQRRTAKQGNAYTVDDDRALVEAMHEHHADIASLAAYRASSLHARSPARTCSWSAIAALFSRRTGHPAGRHGPSGLPTRFRRLVT